LYLIYDNLEVKLYYLHIFIIIIFYKTHENAERKIYIYIYIYIYISGNALYFVSPHYSKYKSSDGSILSSF